MSIRDYIHPGWWAWRYRYQPQTQITDGTSQRYVTYSISRIGGRYRVWVDWNPNPPRKLSRDLPATSAFDEVGWYWRENNGNCSGSNTAGFWCATYSLSRLLGSWRARIWNRRLRRVARNFDKDQAWNEAQLNLRDPTW